VFDTMLTVFWVKFFWLLFGHCIADYTFQTDFIAKGKNRKTAFPGMPWYYIMFAHAITHGALVGMFTGSMTFAILETVLHFGIDVLKCEGYTNMHQDQAMHVGCKVLWAGL
jgi:hypothetical protein